MVNTLTEKLIELINKQQIKIIKELFLPQAKIIFADTGKLYSIEDYLVNLNKYNNLSILSCDIQSSVEFSYISLDEEIIKLMLIIKNEKIESAVITYSADGKMLFGVLENFILNGINLSNNDNKKIPLSIYWKDSNLKYRGMSNNLLEFYGYKSLTDIAGKSDDEIFPPELAEDFINDDRKLISGESAYSTLNYPLTKDGQEFLFTSTKIPIYSQNKIIGILGLGNNITSHYLLEKKQALISAMLQYVIDANPNTIFWKNNKGEYLGSNKNFIKGLNIKSIDDIVGKKDEDFYPEELVKVFKKSDNIILQGEDYTNQIEKLYSNNKVKYINTTKRPIIKDNEIIGIIGFANDETEKIEALKKLKIEKQSLKKSLYHAEVSFFEYYYNEKTIQVDPQLYNYFIKGRVDTQNNDIAEILKSFLHKEDENFVIEKVLNSIEKYTPYQEFECRVVNIKNKVQHKRVKLFIINDNKTNKPIKLIGLLQNINKYKDLEQQFTTVLNQNKIKYWEYYLDSKDLIIHTANKYIKVGKYKNIDFTTFELNGLKIHKNEEKKFKIFNEKAARGQNPGTEVFRFYGDDGVISYQRITYTTIYDDNGIPRKTIGSCSDITEKVTTKKAYEQAKAFQISMNKNIDSGFIFNLNKDSLERLSIRDNTSSDSLWGNPIKYSQFVETIQQYLTTEEEKTDFKMNFSRESLLNNYRKGKTELSKDISFYHNNTKFWYKISYTIIKQPSSENIVAFVIIKNETKKKQLEALFLYLSSTQFAFIASVNIETDDFIVITQDYQHKLTKSSFGKNFFEMGPNNNIPPQVLKDKEILNKLFNKNNIIKTLETQPYISSTFDTEMFGMNFKFQYRINYHDEKKKYICITFSDITNLFKAEKKRQEILKEALEEAKKANKAKTTFLSAMSHDIRTPLNAILGMTEIASDNLNNKEELKEDLGIIKSSSTHLLSIINDILDMSHIESGKIKLVEKPFSLIRECKLLVDRLSPLAKKNNQTIVIKESIKHPNIIGDSIRLQRIIENLLNNSIKFSNKNSKIMLEINEEEKAEDLSSFSFKIIDTGCGIPKQKCNKIFDSFYRTGSAAEGGKEGTGLGLSIAKNLVETMKGSISVNSTIDVGTTFTVTIPFKINDTCDIFQEQPNEEVKSFENMDLSNIHILLVEDNKINALLTDKWCYKLKIKTTIVENGKHACQLLEEDNDFNLVLMDIQMPIMNGYEATKYIRNSKNIKNNNIPIIAMSANTFQEDVEKSLQCGMNEHLGKPIDMNKLYQTIMKYIKDDIND